MDTPVVIKGERFFAGCKKRTAGEDVEIFHVLLEAGEKEQDWEDVLLDWRVPYLDCAGIWNPVCGFNRSIDADYCRFHKSMTARSAPVVCIFSEDGENRCTIAASETREAIGIRAGVREENGMLVCQVQIPAALLGNQKVFELDIRMDTGKKPYYRAIEDVSAWWEQACDIVPVCAPDVAKEPVYSTWYAYHQNLMAEEIEEECSLAVKLGFRTVILDDGWQTDDNNRGYAFCGDWEVSGNRFPDFAAHIRKVHDMGLRYMIWYSVPFLGMKSQRWEEFKDMLLYVDENPLIRAGVLDPRYKKVRDYLTDTYAEAMEKWDLDGLKLDFVDCMVETPDSPAYDPEKMDFDSVQEALDCLMRAVYERLSEKKKDVMIEFRQSYIGPNMRRYGNMFRVGDCPDSAIRNRVGIVDLRMLSGQTAVHSDPLMWHEQEEPQVAAIQIISSIFSTPQISVKMKTLTPDMQRMLRFWISFMRENRTLLQDQPICALEPHNLYPVVWTQDESRAVMAVYSENRILRIPDDVKECVILNGTKGKRVVLDTCGQKGSVTVRDCFGEAVEAQVKDGGFYEVSVPVAGQVYWQAEA